MFDLHLMMAIAPLLVQAYAQPPPYYASPVSSYTASDVASKVFKSFYPTPSGQEIQPILRDPVLNTTYPLNLSNPDTIPDKDDDPVYFPRPIANLTLSEQKAIVASVVGQIQEISTSPYFPTNCSKCIAALSVAKSAAQLAPSLVPDAMVSLCNSSHLHSASVCQEDFQATTFGYIWTQILALADVSGLDGQYICNSLSSSYCPALYTSPLNVSDWLTPKPKNITIPKPSGKRVKVAHLSDIHLDPRYKVGSEGNCTSGLCCRGNNPNSALPNGSISHAAPHFGYFTCDSPYDLSLAALQSVSALTGTSKECPLAWTIFTGDEVSHDPQSELSRAYVEYIEYSVAHMFRKFLTGPVFLTIGNHDTNPEAIDAPHSLPGDLGQQMSWNFDHVSSLWKHEGWLDDAAAKQAKVHYGAYSIRNHYGLRMITFNTDFWYHSNFLNFINASNPDVSGTFKFLIQELDAAEKAGERVWLFGHVLSGWDGSNPLPNPTNLFYQIVDRYSPHVIANVFFGHTHEDEQMIFYSNNGTNRSLNTAQTPGWIAPSVTPLTNLNSGFRMYEVDTGNFEIFEAYTYYANVNSFANLTTHGPVFQLEYSTRQAYGPAAGWPADAPLNATFWHAVTQVMEKDRSLVSTFNTYQGKSSIKSPNCTNDACAAAKVCYMRSGSTALGRQCPQGYGSVQSPFKPTL